MTKTTAEKPRSNQASLRIFLPLSRWWLEGESVCTAPLVDRALDPRRLTGDHLDVRQPFHLEPGRRLGRWIVRNRLGRGAVASVYTAEDASTGERVALKVLHHAPEGEDDHAVERLQREIELLGRIDHPGVCRARELFGEGECTYLVVDFIPGRSLQEVLDVERRLPATRAVALARRIAAALSATHAAGVLHRDLKPGNVMLRPDGQPVLLDFGYALANDVERVTQAGVWVGTLAYAAPELLKQQPASVQSDLYSLAVILYQCLTGTLPFSGKTYGEIASAILYREPPPLATARVIAAPGLEKLLFAALARSPSDRPTSVEAFREALARYDATTELECEEPTLQMVVDREEPTAQVDFARDEPTARVKLEQGGAEALPGGPASDEFEETTAQVHWQPEESTKPAAVSVSLEAKVASEGTGVGAASAEREAPPPALVQPAVDLMAMRMQLAELSASLVKERYAKGLIAGDVPELDRLEKNAEAELGRANWKATLVAMTEALELAQRVEITAELVQAKLERLEAALDDKAVARRAGRCQEFVTRAKQAASMADWSTANQEINRGFERLRSR